MPGFRIHTIGRCRDQRLDQQSCSRCSSRVTSALHIAQSSTLAFLDLPHRGQDERVLHAAEEVCTTKKAYYRSAVYVSGVPAAYLPPCSVTSLRKMPSMYCRARHNEPRITFTPVLAAGGVPKRLRRFRHHPAGDLREKVCHGVSDVHTLSA